MKIDFSPGFKKSYKKLLARRPDYAIIILKKILFTTILLSIQTLLDTFTPIQSNSPLQDPLNKVELTKYGCLI